MKKIKLISGSILVLIIIISIAVHSGYTGKPDYVTSENCKNCHSHFYNSWKNNTLHPWQFQPVDKSKGIKADFSKKIPAVTFKKSDIEYVIGSKWEQVYARKIDGEYYPFTAKWMISTNKWVPYKVKSWKKVPMSKKCNGCHTTGFDARTYEFKEFGIGCEACHGPGSQHVSNRRMVSDSVCTVCHSTKQEFKSDIVRTVSSSVCGQCHSRGKNAGGTPGEKQKFNFPVKFKPGQDNLDSALKEISKKGPKKGKYWWGNGISKNRHQEFIDWRKSKHSSSLTLLKEKYTKERGKLTPACLKCHSTDYRLSKGKVKPDLSNAKYGITCVSCHDSHGFDRLFTYQRDGTNQCGGCHIDSMSVISGHKGKPHDMHPPGTVLCADCHMPYTVKTGGALTIRSHAFKIVSPLKTREFKMPNACQNGGCHDDKPLNWAIKEFKKHYPKFRDNKTDSTGKIQ